MSVNSQDTNTNKNINGDINVTNIPYETKCKN
jgi:hypothetical protein